MNKESAKTLAILRRAIDKELKTLGAPSLPGMAGVGDWMSKTWNNLTKADLAAADVVQRRRNALRQGKKASLPSLVRDLDRNQFRGLIMDLTVQVLEDQIIFDQPDTLYALELAVELAQMREGVPVHSLLLNAIHQKNDVYGNVDALRQTQHPMDVARMEKLKTVGYFYSNEVLPKSQVDGTVAQTVLNDISAERLDGRRAQSVKSPKIAAPKPSEKTTQATESELFMLAPPSFDGLAGDVTYIEQREKNVRNSRQAIVAQWKSLEERVSFRVDALRAESADEVLKKELWNRQRAIEQLVYDTEAACADEDEKAYFKELVIRSLPALKSVMGKAISKRPEHARQVYEVLDKLAECEVSVQEYLEIAVGLGQVKRTQVLTEIMQDLTFGNLGEQAVAHVTALIEKETEIAEQRMPSAGGGSMPVAFAAR